MKLPIAIAPSSNPNDVILRVSLSSDRPSEYSPNANRPLSKAAFTLSPETATRWYASSKLPAAPAKSLNPNTILNVDKLIV